MARPYPLRRPALAAIASVSLVLTLSGCFGDDAPEPGTTTSAPVATSAPPPVLVPEGSAHDNLPYFAGVVQSVWAGPDNASGRAYIDALVTAGFDKAAMQVTPDESTVGNPAESIQFSVRWGEDCLIGQVGPATGDPVAVVDAGLADGGCLVGTTRPIDW